MPLPNPVAALAASRHLHFSTELFYSLINLAVVGRALSGGEAGAAGAEGNGVMQWLGFGSGGGVGGGSARGGVRAGLEGGAQR